jgi:hypothetical protein
LGISGAPPGDCAPRPVVNEKVRISDVPRDVPHAGLRGVFEVSALDVVQWRGCFGGQDPLTDLEVAHLHGSDQDPHAVPDCDVPGDVHQDH